MQEYYYPSTCVVVMFLSHAATHTTLYALPRNPLTTFMGCSDAHATDPRCARARAHALVLPHLLTSTLPTVTVLQTIHTQTLPHGADAKRQCRR